MGLRDRATNAWRGWTHRSPKTPLVLRANIAGINSQRFGPATDPAPPPSVYGNYFLTSTPTYRAVYLRADGVSSAPLVVMKKLVDGSVEPAGESDLQDTLNRVNPWWTMADLIYSTEQNLSLWGSAYWFIEAEGDKQTLWPLNPTRVTPIPDRSPVEGGNQYIKGFKYTPEGSGTAIPLLPEEVGWFRRIDPNDEFEGASGMQPFRATADMGISATQYNRNFFRNGAFPSDIMFTVNDPLDPDEYDQFVDRLNKRLQGTGNAGNPLVWDMSQGAKPEKLGLSQKDMEYMATLSWTVEDAARAFGVMPPLLMDRSATTLDNVKQARIEFFNTTVSSEWNFIAREINEFVLPNLTKDASLFVMFDTSEVPTLQEARLPERELGLKEVMAGTLTINEFRAAQQRDSVDWGDVFWAPINVVPVSDGEAPELPETQQDAITEGIDRTARPLPPTRGKVLTVVKQERTILDDNIGEFEAMQRGLFDAQAKSVEAAIARSDLGELPVDERAALNPAIEADWLLIKQLIDPIFNPTSWVSLFATRGRPLYRVALSEAGRAVSDAFTLGPFDPNTPGAREFIDRRTAFWATRVNEETAKQITGQIVEAQAAGESLPQIQQRVKKVFDFSDDVRAERIARTEVGAAASAGDLEAYDQAPVVDRLQWITVLDSRTRASHVSAHNQVIAKGTSFQVGGARLDAPRIGAGGGAGPAGEVINCRCTAIPLLTQQQPFGGEPVEEQEI